MRNFPVSHPPVPYNSGQPGSLASPAAGLLEGSLGRKVPPVSPPDLVVQGLFAICIGVGSGDPVRVLRLLHNEYTGYK